MQTSVNIEEPMLPKHWVCILTHSCTVGHRYLRQAFNIIHLVHCQIFKFQPQVYLMKAPHVPYEGCMMKDTCLSLEKVWWTSICLRTCVDDNRNCLVLWLYELDSWILYLQIMIMKLLAENIHNRNKVHQQYLSTWSQFAEKATQVTGRTTVSEY